MFKGPEVMRSYLGKCNLLIMIFILKEFFKTSTGALVRAVVRYLAVIIWNILVLPNRLLALPSSPVWYVSFFCLFRSSCTQLILR